MTKRENDKIEQAEQICTILARKEKATAKDAADELDISVTTVNRTIKKYNLWERAAWLRYDKEIEVIEEKQKQLDKWKLQAEYILEKTLENL